MNRYTRVILMLLLCILPLITTAQEHLKGKWVSYSLTYRGRERELKEKQDKTRFVFEAGENYIKYHYLCNNGSDPLVLRYSFLNGKLEVNDSNGKTLKRKKVKERGSYQVSGREIVFFTSNDRYSAQYKLEGKTLLLTFAYDSLNTGNYILKFRRD